MATGTRKSPTRKNTTDLLSELPILELRSGEEDEREVERKEKELDDQYTFLCPHCNSVLASMDCVVDFSPALRRYIQEKENSIKNEELWKGFLFYEMSFGKAENTKGSIKITCGDALNCLLSKFSTEDVTSFKNRHLQSKAKSVPGAVDALYKSLPSYIKPAKRTDFYEDLCLFMKMQDTTILDARFTPVLEDRCDGMVNYEGLKISYGNQSITLQNRRCPKCGCEISSLTGSAHEQVVALVGNDDKKIATMTAVRNYVQNSRSILPQKLGLTVEPIDTKDGENFIAFRIFGRAAKPSEKNPRTDVSAKEGWDMVEQIKLINLPNEKAAEIKDRVDLYWFCGTSNELCEKVEIHPHGKSAPLAWLRTQSSVDFEELFNCPNDVPNRKNRELFNTPTIYGHIGLKEDSFLQYERNVMYDCNDLPRCVAFAAFKDDEDATPNVELPLLWSMAVFGLLPVVGTEGDDKDFMNAVYTPGVLYPKGSSQRKNFESVVYCGVSSLS